MQNSSSQLATNRHVCSWEAAAPLPAATTASVLVGFRLDLNELPKLGGEENQQPPCVSVLVFVINWVVGSHHPKTGVSILDDENQQPPSYSISQYGIRIKHPRTFGSKTVQLNAAVFFQMPVPAPLRSSAASQVSPLFFPPWTGFRP